MVCLISCILISLTWNILYKSNQDIQDILVLIAICFGIGFLRDSLMGEGFDSNCECGLDGLFGFNCLKNCKKCGNNPCMCHGDPVEKYDGNWEWAPAELMM